jgi:hypothetical protein
MSDDYYQQNVRSGLNRGVEPTPENQERWFAGLNHEERASVLDRYDTEAAENADQELGLEEARGAVERHVHISRLRQIHGALRRSGR